MEYAKRIVKLTDMHGEQILSAVFWDAFYMLPKEKQKLIAEELEDYISKNAK